MDTTQFPYIKSLLINDCYAYQNLQIDTNPQEKPFQHIILTGKNGSGKSTILSRVNHLISFLKYNTNRLTFTNQIQSYQQLILQNPNPNHSNTLQYKQELKKLTDIKILFHKDYEYMLLGNQKFILASFQASRKVTLNEVKTVTKETDFINQLNQNQTFIQGFKQYLVNKKVYQALEFFK